MAGIINDILKPIANDNVSGSTSIAIMSIDRILAFLNAHNDYRVDKLTDYVSKGLVKSQPSMGIILNLAYGLRSSGRSNNKKDVIKYLNTFKINIKRHAEQVAKNAFPVIKKYKKIMTYSSSKTVLDSLVYAKRHKAFFDVLVLESRPKNEGYDMAVELKSEGIHVDYTTDATGMSMLSNGYVNAVFIGGDAIYKGNIIAKSGTTAIVTICNAKSIPVYVLSVTEKRIPGIYASGFIIQNKPAGELHKFKNRTNLKVINRYFEVVLQDHFNRVITDLDA